MLVYTQYIIMILIRALKNRQKILYIMKKLSLNQR